MAKFRVAVSGDFFRPDGSLIYPSCDFSPITANPAIEYQFLKAKNKSDEVQAEEFANFDAAIIWTEKFTRNSVTSNSRLALIQRWGAGLERIDIPACTDAGVAVARVRDGVRRPVAVMLLTLVLALTGKLLIKDRLVRAGPKKWAERADNMGVGLVGRTLGLLGVGNTGTETFKLAKPLEMKFIAHDPVVDVDTMQSLGVRMVGLEDLFRESDILAIACPLTEKTHHLVNAKRLAMMKPTAFLINGARGPIVDQAALVEALRNGRIAGAGLDVLEQEPPDPDDPILELENVVLTPHALCWTDQCFANSFAEAANGVLDMMHGRMPSGLVNEEISHNSDWRRKLTSYRDRFGD